MKNLKWLSSIALLSVFLFSSCKTPTISASDSETTINNEVKEFTVLGNLRVEITRKDNVYDKIMTTAIEEYGQRVDVINIKADNEMSTFGKKIVNCLVIRYE